MNKTRSYPRLHIGEFGAHLIEHGDLDPIYLALHDIAPALSSSQLYRWLLAYWCFYDAGAASYLSEFEAEGFWNAMAIAAENKPSAQAPIGAKNPVNGGWPRGKERRHFRGAQAMRGYECLRTLYPQPERAVVDLAQEAFIVTHHHVNEGNTVWHKAPEMREPIHYATMAARVKKWKQFGSWITFKIGDMLERCAGIPILFEYDTVMYETPSQAALMQWKILHDAPANATIDDEPAAIFEVVGHLINYFGYFKAPPDFQRPVGMQEIETILCKWKSHMGGSYPLFNDIDEIVHGVAPWIKTCTTAERFYRALPKRPKETSVETKHSEHRRGGDSRVNDGPHANEGGNPTSGDRRPRSILSIAGELEPVHSVVAQEVFEHGGSERSGAD